MRKKKLGTAAERRAEDAASIAKERLLSELQNHEDRYGVSLLEEGLDLSLIHHRGCRERLRCDH